MPSTAFLIFMGINAVIAYLIVGKRRKNQPALTTAPTPAAPTQAPAPATLQKRYHIDRYPTPSPIPSDEELRIVRVDLDEIHIRPCPHAHLPRAIAFDVYGLSIKTSTMPRCPACAQILFEALFERCAECGKGIAVGSLVCISWIGAAHPYTHVECAEIQSLLCGRWGHGRLVPLERLETEQGAAAPPGTVTLMQLSEARKKAEIEKYDHPDGNADSDEGDGGAGSKPNAN